jgi:polysaccharide export outer membrane protein
VLISVRDYKSKKVYLTGAVQKSGLFPLDSSTTTVLELIANYILRGSIAELSAEKGISELIQQKNSIKVNLRELLDLGVSEANVQLQPGDVVYIPPTSFSDLTQHKIYVLGKVNRPGVYDFQEGLTALDGCILAGGFAQYAAPNRSTITRREADGTQEIIKINLTRVRKGDEEDVPLKPGDRIFVPESWL